jgi:hypothetical protein
MVLKSPDQWVQMNDMDLIAISIVGSLLSPERKRVRRQRKFELEELIRTIPEQAKNLCTYEPGKVGVRELRTMAMRPFLLPFITL